MKFRVYLTDDSVIESSDEPSDIRKKFGEGNVLKIKRIKRERK